MECEAEGDPQVNFVWLKNGIPIEFPTSKPPPQDRPSTGPGIHTGFVYRESAPQNSLSGKLRRVII